jgi:acid phosphatase
MGAAVLVRRCARGDDDDGIAASGPRTVTGAPPLPPYRAPEFSPALSFLALGDTGWPGAIVESVAAAMDRTAAELPFSFVSLLGDNFYHDGVESTLDPRWATGFEQVFSGPNLAVPFYAALGNHDHSGNPEAQVEYTAGKTRWRMPGQYYSFVLPAGGGHEAEFIVLDTEAIRREDKSTPEQLRWFEDKLAHSCASWKIVIGHHPLRSNGVHGSIARVRAALEDLLDEHAVALYLSGHDHDLELLDSGRGFLQVVSGAGSSPRDMRWGRDTLFASAAPGFVWTGIQGRELAFVFVDAERGPLFSRTFTLRQLA